MLEAAKVEDDRCPNCSRTKRCSICDRKWRTDEKCKLLVTWGRAPRTWINRAVILLSMLNFVLAEYGSELTEDKGKSTNENGHYSRQWAVSIEGGQEVADRIAAKHDFVNLGKIFGNFYHFEHKRLAKRSLEPHSEFHRNLVNEAEVKWARQQIVKKRTKRDLITPRIKSSYIRFNDVEWPTMWYLNRGQGLDMNVQGAWREGISGSGVVVTILDDGLEKTHPDLVANYDPQASYDVNNHDEDPMPRYDSIDSNRHGTRCAGEVAAVANNSLCSVGVAFGASVGGVRMLDGDVTDAVEARSLSLNPQHIDIYSASWGPDDDGKTVDGPGELATRAFIEGVTKGRQGKGSIFVWASGNGGREHDNCNCDGYTNSIWTLSISSATEKGLVPWYSEACSSTLATTYSSGAVNERQIVTTDLRHKCTNGHTGTSASAPLAAGICALALEANRDLTWRDMQHIVVRTARPANLKSSDWKVNGVGRNVSHSFGYGLMDATAMVRLARTWKTVPEQHRCEVSAPHVDKPIPPRSKVILKLNVTECAGVNFLEHVQAKISLSSAQRGGLQIFLTSPAGTKATLLAKRPQDTSRNPFYAWPFMSVHTWGEMPFGVWQLEIHYEGHVMGRAILQEWSLLFYGTLEVPAEEEKWHRFSPSLKPVSGKPNIVHSNPKFYKPTFGSSGSPNRKTLKNWKGKQTNSRTDKIASAASPKESGGPEPSQVFPSAPAGKSPGKSGQKYLHLSKLKNPNSGRELSKTTWAPPSTHGLPLTIVLGPGGDLAARQKVPDVFQKYPKVEQLFPHYVNANRPYSEENYLISRIKSASTSSANPGPKSKSLPNGQKSERQNRFDTPSIPRKTTGSRKLQSPRKQLIQGHFEGWQMLFYGTDTSPNEEGKGTDVQGNRGNGKNKKGPVEAADQKPELGSPRGGWPGTDPPGGPSSACAIFSESAYRCIECVSGLYLHEGRCEAVCPPKTYPGQSLMNTAVCLPCHYTCLTCAGESDGHCVSCHLEASPVASGLADPGPFAPPKPSKKEKTQESTFEWKEDGGPGLHPSWGKRATAQRTVTKKILDSHGRPRALYYCYPSRVMDQIEYSGLWYRRMTLFFGLNFGLLLAIVIFLIFRKYFSTTRKDDRNDRTWKYLNIKNGNPNIHFSEDSILYLSSSSDEENKESLVGSKNPSKT